MMFLDLLAPCLPPMELLLRLTRHARNRLRWITQRHPGLKVERLLGLIPGGELEGYDDQGNRRVRITINAIHLIVVVDEERARGRNAMGGVSLDMAVYTYDAEADVLYVLLSNEADAVIERTEELGPNLHVDLDGAGQIVGVEFLYPQAQGLSAEPVKERYGIDLSIPFTFAA